ncbi:peptidoglycan-binding protein [Pseudomonas syringae]|nr:peptidoglycan-binding protein [Pseudomonas syringae]MBD8790655.1 peptidoglycan-binding protein [Pseudomonas syringae]MBD8798893.1 peptidoglycan-binding protein [Pseudomonas syringae]MBD8809720.1 peptidoglycan-binding protein [Pseudomonas syringae]
MKRCLTTEPNDDEPTYSGERTSGAIPLTTGTVASRSSTSWKNRKLHVAFIMAVAACGGQPAGVFAGVAAPVNPYATQNAPQNADNTEGSLNVDERRLIQEGLIWGGFYNGWIDGQFGKGTRDAIAMVQQHYKQPGTGTLNADLAVHLGGLALGERKKYGWKTLTEPRSGVTLAYPSTLLTRTTNPEPGFVNIDSEDRSVSLQILRIDNVKPDAIDTLYADLTGNGKSTVTYSFRKGGLFILAGERGTGKYYSRYEQRGGEVRGYDLVWTSSRNAEMQAISVLISNSFEPFDTPAPKREPDYPYLVALAQAAKNEPGGNPPQVSANTPSPGRQPVQQQPVQQQPVQQQPSQQPTTAQNPAKTDVSDGKGTRFSYTYQAPRDARLEEAYRFTRRADLLVGNVEIDAMDGMFMMPRPLHYVGMECGMVNAFYSPKDSAIFLCYEMVNYLLRQADELNVNNDPDFPTEYVKSNLRFILLHETGHAFIDLLNLPSTGREEDAVDQMAATMILMHVNRDEPPEQLTRVLSMTATWFKTNASLQNGAAAHDTFSDEHSLNEQRYYNLLCMVYGRNPQEYASIVDRGLLPKSRAARCPQETSKIVSSWARLLLPHFAPRYQKIANDTVNRQDAQSRQ